MLIESGDQKDLTRGGVCCYDWRVDSKDILDVLMEDTVLAGSLPEPARLGRLPATHENAGFSMACRMGKTNYSHDAMIDLIIASPGISQGQLAAHFGYSEGWVSNIIASDAFQAMMAKRREEVIDPMLKATLEERFKGLVVRSLHVLMKKLEQPDVPANVAIRAAELGAKSLGLGGHAPPPIPTVDPNRLVTLAERLVELNRPKERIIDGQVIQG